MKSESINIIITARNLLDKATELCCIEDKYISSSGLVILQDAMELIFLGSLVELGIDEQKSLENFSFDQLIGELKKNGIKIPKSGTIKALNKERVIVKHYGQLAEPETVKNYLSAAQQCIDGLIPQVFKKPIEEIWLHELVKNEEAKTYLKNAIRFLDKKDFYNALIEIRKVIFIEIEIDYSIFDWKDISTEEANKSHFFSFGKVGWKAPYYTRNKEWIDENVRDPLGYIQLDHQQLKADLLEWGVNTQDFWNIWRFTPPVFRENKDSKWVTKTDITYLTEAATEENVKHCLDKTISILVKKRNHFDIAKYLHGHPKDFLEIKTKQDNTKVYQKASTESTISHTLEKDISLIAVSFVRGLDSEEIFINVFQILNRQKENQKFISGYIKKTDCKIPE